MVTKTVSHMAMKYAASGVAACSAAGMGLHTHTQLLASSRSEVVAHTARHLTVKVSTSYCCQCILCIN